MLSKDQKLKVAKFKVKFNKSAPFRNDVDQSVIKLEETGKDEVLKTTEIQDDDLLEQCRAKRQAYIDAVNELPEL